MSSAQPRKSALGHDREKTRLDVARAVGLAVPEARLLRIGSDSVLLLEIRPRGLAFEWTEDSLLERDEPSRCT